MARQDVAALELQIADLRNEAKMAASEEKRSNNDDVANAKIHTLESQVAGLLQVLDEQATASAELLALRPKYENVKNELSKLKEVMLEKKEKC